MQTPAGWYDDGSGRQRWWDGAQWTDQYATPQQIPAPPVAPGSPAMTAPATASPAMAAPAMGVPPTMAAPAPGKKRVGVLGWIALGVTVVGAIVSWIPLIMGFGWVLLGIGFVLSIVSLFLRGAKWPGIVGIALSIVAGVISGIVLFTIFLGYASTHPGEFDGSGPAPAASDAATTDPGTTATDAAGRPSAQEVADGFLVIMDAAGAKDQYTADEALCIGQHLVDSDVSTESLVNVANGRDVQSDVAEQQLVAQTTMEAVTACKTAP